MTEDIGESYTDLGGQLASETERERGLRKIAELKQRIADEPCPLCTHELNRYHREGVCFYPTPPRGEDCETCGPTEGDEQ